MPLLDLLEVAGPAPPQDVASGVRATALLHRLTLRDAARLPEGPLLVVDDVASSRWTLTVAAALLRDAGASEVLPLVGHLRP